MKNLTESPQVPHFRRLHRGFSLIELLVVLGALSSVAAMAFINLSGTSSAVRETKLRQDVTAVNSAVRTYIANGGSLPATLTADAVIAKLKTTASTAVRSKIAGMRGTMVDLRLTGLAATEDGTSRAVWDPSANRFNITSSGSGFREFLLDPSAVPAAPVEEDRNVLMALDHEDKWIWKFDDQSPAAAAPLAPAAVSDSPVTPATQVSNTSVLQAPDFSKPGALYPYSAYDPDLKVSLVDSNPPNTSAMFYAIGTGPWLRWDGTALSIPRELTTQVRAYSAPLDSDAYEESAVNSATYETIFFAGNGSGVFKNPIGDSGMTSNLPAGTSNPVFTWGSPATGMGFTMPNSLTYTGKSFNNIAPDQTFELGTLTYYNGTIYTGTSATSVQLSVNLNLTVPGVVETLPFTFNLLSTVNKNKNADDDADYVYIPKVSTKFNTTIKGQVFYLVLSFGSNSGNGFTTIDEFHTHENKTMTGSIYGKFTTTPPA